VLVTGNTAQSAPGNFNQVHAKRGAQGLGQEPHLRRPGLPRHRDHPCQGRAGQRRRWNRRYAAGLGQRTQGRLGPHRQPPAPLAAAVMVLATDSTAPRGSRLGDGLAPLLIWAHPRSPLAESVPRTLGRRPARAAALGPNRWRAVRGGCASCRAAFPSRRHGLSEPQRPLAHARAPAADTDSDAAQSDPDYRGTRLGRSTSESTGACASSHWHGPGSTSGSTPLSARARCRTQGRRTGTGGPPAARLHGEAGRRAPHRAPCGGTAARRRPTVTAAAGGCARKSRSRSLPRDRHGLFLP
jgi:hypothetical protein